MKDIAEDTARQIAFCYREIEVGTKLLMQIEGAIRDRKPPDIRDAFGRAQNGLQLGVPSGESGHRLFNVPWSLAQPIIEAHVASQRAALRALSVKAMAEMDGDDKP